MQVNKWKVGDTVYKPSGLEPLTVSMCLIIGVALSDHALAMNYNSGKKLLDYSWGDQYQIEYVVVEESREGISTRRYTEESLYETREAAMEFVYKKAKEVLGVEEDDGNSNNQDSE